MSDTFLPGSGFDTYEQQDKVLVGLGGGTAAKVAVRILQQQGFAVAGAVVKLSAEEEPLVQSAKEAAKALGIECATLNAEALAALPQDILARLILPLGSFTPEDVQEMAADFNV